jgi:membrane associated rhomboid family serine protease
MNLIGEIKKSYKSGSVHIKFIYLNFALFVGIWAVKAILMLFSMEGLFVKLPHGYDIYSDFVVDWLGVSSDPKVLITKPWTLITYMFTHIELMHIFFNMLVLYWFGTIFLQFLGSKQFIGVYFLGGFAGAILFILSFNIFPFFRTHYLGAPAIGASASVIAILVAACFYRPYYEIMLLFFGKVKLVWVAIVTIVLDFISIPMSNAGGHIAHLGGALFGYIFIVQYKKGNDLSLIVNKIFSSIAGWFKPKPKMHISYKKPKTDLEFNEEKRINQAKIDLILEKIAKNGYGSLSKEEKEYLFKNSSKY